MLFTLSPVYWGMFSSPPYNEHMQYEYATDGIKFINVFDSIDWYFES